MEQPPAPGGGRRVPAVSPRSFPTATASPAEPGARVFTSAVTPSIGGAAVEAPDWMMVVVSLSQLWRRSNGRSTYRGGGGVGGMPPRFCFSRLLWAPKRQPQNIHLSPVNHPACVELAAAPMASVILLGDLAPPRRNPFCPFFFLRFVVSAASQREKPAGA